MNKQRFGFLVLVAAGAGAVITAGVAGAGAGSVPNRRQAVSARRAAVAVPAFVTQAANRVTAINGDAKPSSAQLVETERQTAVAAQSSDTVDSNQPVYYVVLRGHFAATKGFLGPGAKVR